MANVFDRLRFFLAELKRRKVYRVAAAYAAFAFVALQVAAIAFPALHLPLLAQTVVVVLVAVGFPIALVLAWAFEISPEGVRRTISEEGSSATRILHPKGNLGWDLALLAAVTIACGGLAWAGWTQWLAPAAEAGEDRRAAASDTAEAGPLDPTRVAVLYFDDLSPDGSLEHVAKGLTEALIHELQEAGGTLNVLSRYAVKPFRDEEVPLDSIVGALRVGSLVAGSVERRGELLSATVQLVDGETLEQEMSERVEARGDDPLALRDSIVDRGARLLRRRLGTLVRTEEMRAETGSTRAWELFQRAEQMREDAEALARAQDTVSARRRYERADSLLAQVERLDHGWTQPVLARGWLALEQARLRSPRLAQADPEVLRRGIAHAERALELSPGDPRALELRGNLRFFLGNALGPPDSRGLMENAEEDLRAATVEDPSRARAWGGLAYLYFFEGRIAEAQVAARRMRDADPFLAHDADYLYLSARLALEREDLEVAERLYRRGQELFPKVSAYRSDRLLIIASTGATPERADTAWQVLRELEALLPSETYPPGHIMVGAVLARAGLRDSAEAVIERAQKAASGDGWTPYFTAYARLTLGDTAAALDALERHVGAMPERRRYLASDWWFEPLRDHPRFRALISPEETGGATASSTTSDR